MDKLLKFVIGILLVAIAGLASAALVTFPAMWLWNYVMPLLFGLKTITVYQAWALTALGALLFKSSK